MRMAPPARAVARSLVSVALAITSLAHAPAAAPALHVRAAETDLTLVTTARYEVEPDKDRVRVTVEIVARNHRAETTTRRFYFERAYLAVMPGTSRFAVSGSTGPRVSISGRTERYTMLRIDFGSRLFGGREARFTLTFDLADPGGAPDREIRVDDGLVAFPVWAFASDGASGSRVSVEFPAGYDVMFEGGDAPARQDTIGDGPVVYETGSLAEPLAYFRYVIADRPSAYDEVARTIELDGGDSAELVLRAWSDDPAWAERTGQLWAAGLPLIARWVGLDWPWREPIVVEEAVTRSKGGYAGVVDPDARRIEIAYWAPPLVVLHAAAHGWLNGSLLADRWATEAFASLYAERAAAELGLDAASAELTEELAASAIPLNAWDPDGDVDETADAYAHAASLALARAIAERAGDDALRDVWAWAAGGIAAYQQPADDPRAPDPVGRTPGDPEPTAGIPDWRGLLDLLEDAARRPFDDLWRAWVVRPDEALLLDVRAGARRSYQRTIALADGWALPRGIREALRSWQFTTAESLLSDARTVLAQRDALRVEASRVGVDLPPTLRRLFEGGGTLAEASAEAAAESTALATIDAARIVQPAAPDLLTQIGLLGTTPQEDLANARAAFAAGNLAVAASSAEQASGDWSGAWEEGRRRALLGVAIVAVLAVMFSATLGGLRRRRSSAARQGVSRT